VYTVRFPFYLPVRYSANCANLKSASDLGMPVLIRACGGLQLKFSDELFGRKQSVGLGHVVIWCHDARARAREIVLLALESADDILVGLTNDSYQLGESVEAFIAQVS